MKIRASFGPPASSVEKLQGISPQEVELVMHLKPGDVFEYTYAIPAWGVRGIRMTGRGTIGLVTDNTKVFDGLNLDNDISIEYLRKEKKQAGIRFALRPPTSVSRKGALTECWHTKLVPKEHDGLIIYGPRSNQLKLTIEW